MEKLRKSLSQLSLAEPNLELSVHTLSTSNPRKTGWLRYRTKLLTLLNNNKIFHRYLNRFFKWPNRFVILTSDTLHIFKTESENKTKRSLNLADVKTVTLCSESDVSDWCIKLVPINPEELPLLLAAPLQSTQEEWFFKIQDHLNKCQNGEQNLYSELPNETENMYHMVEMSDVDFLRSSVTYHKSRDQLKEDLDNYGIPGNYVIRKSRKEGDKAVLSVCTTNVLSEYIIFRNNGKVSLNKKVSFDNIQELFDYYKTCSLPSSDIKLTRPFYTFKSSDSDTR